MSISSEIRRAGPFAGNGSTVNFPFTFKVFNTSQVVVTRTVSGAETVLTLTTDYTVTLNSNQDTSPGGTVTMLVAPATGQSITITSNVANLQPTVLANLGGFYPEVINDSLDRATIQIQQLDERLDRALVIPVSSSGVSTQLPAPTASSLIGWNTLGTGLQNYSNIPVGSTIYQYVHQTTAIAGQTVVGLPVNYTLGTNAITVFLNGLRVEPTLDYVETNTSTITFNSGLSSGDLVIVAIHGNLSSGILTLAPVLGAVSSLNFASGDYIEATGASTFRARKLTAATYAALTAIPAASRHDDMLVYVASRSADGDGGDGHWRFDAGSSATANGGTILAPDAGSGRWIRQDVQFYKPEWFGAVGNGTTNDTVALQACATAVRLAGGGTIVFTPGKNYRVTESILVGSKTTIIGYNATISAAQATFVGTAANLNCFLIRNYNYSASTLTDESIEIVGLKTDFGDVVISGGGAHAIAMRYVDRVRVRDCEFLNGENGTALLACRDCVTSDCFAQNTTNCAFDHWDGASNQHVVNCTVRNTVNAAQGIQFSGASSSGAARTTVDCLAQGCNVYGVRGGASSAIVFNSVTAASAVWRGRSINNHIDDCAIGLVFEGSGGQHLSMGDTFRGVDGLPIFIQRNNSVDPDDCRVLYPTLIDCDHDPVNLGMISISGARNQVLGVTVVNTGAVAYERIAYFSSNSSACVLEILTGDDGTTARVLDSGASNRIIDLALSTGSGRKTLTVNANIVLDGGAYTPALTGVANVADATPGTFSWSRVGNLVTVAGKIAIDPTAATTLTRLGVSLPVASNFANDGDCNGSIVSADAGGVTQVGVVYADATNDRAEYYFSPSGAGAETWYANFSYRVI